MSSKPILYYLPLSPPARAVALTAAALGVELDIKQVDLLGRENYKPDYLKVNRINKFSGHFIELFCFVDESATFNSCT